MPVKIDKDGNVWFDTPEEAAAYEHAKAALLSRDHKSHSAIENGRPDRQRSKPKPRGKDKSKSAPRGQERHVDSSDADPRMTVLAGALGGLGHAKDVLDYIGYRESVERNTLKRALGLEDQKFGGMITSIGAFARKHGLTLEDLLLKDNYTTPNGVEVRYRISDRLRKAVPYKVTF